MKKPIILVLVLATCIVTNAQNVNIPDANFKNYLVNYWAINTNQDDEIQVSEAEAYNGEIYCHQCGFADLTGIEAFTSVKSIRLQFNWLTSVDVSGCVALTKLNLFGNELSSLNVSGCVLLDTLDCSYSDHLTSLDVSHNPALLALYCNNNALTSLDVTNNLELQVLDCGTNQLTSLDVSQNVALMRLGANANLLTQVSVSHNPNLVRLFFNDNQLTMLNAANGNNINLEYFRANGNPNLSCIQVDNPTYSVENWIGANFTFDTDVSFDESCTVGTNNVDKLSDIQIYPNPASSFVNVWSDESIRINVFNQVGKIVGSQKLSRGNNRVELNHLTSGVYFLRYENGQVHRFIKE